MLNKFVARMDGKPLGYGGSAAAAGADKKKRGKGPAVKEGGKGPAVKEGGKGPAVKEGGKVGCYKAGGSVCRGGGAATRGVKFRGVK